MSSQRGDEFRGDRFSVRMKGAFGDGVTNDRAAIQAAINANASVYLPRGVYKTDGVITVPAGHMLFGDGPGVSVIHQVHLPTLGSTTNGATPYDVLTITGSDTQVRGLTARGPAGLGYDALGSANGQKGITIESPVPGPYTGPPAADVARVLLENVVVEQCQTNGIQKWPGVSRLRMRHVDVNDCGNEGILRINGYVNSGNDILEHINISRCPSWGIDFNEGRVHLSHFVIDGCGSLTGGGGFFDGGGIALSLNPTISRSVIDMVANSASTCSSVSKPFVSGDIGGQVVVTAALAGGSGWIEGSYTITGVSGGIATVSGGPLAVPGSTDGYCIITTTQVSTVYLDDVSVHHGRIINCTGVGITIGLPPGPNVLANNWDIGHIEVVSEDRAMMQNALTISAGGPVPNLGGLAYSHIHNIRGINCGIYTSNCYDVTLSHNHLTNSLGVAGESDDGRTWGIGIDSGLNRYGNMRLFGNTCNGFKRGIHVHTCLEGIVTVGNKANFNTIGGIGGAVTSGIWSSHGDGGAGNGTYDVAIVPTTAKLYGFVGNNPVGGQADIVAGLIPQTDNSGSLGDVGHWWGSVWSVLTIFRSLLGDFAAPYWGDPATPSTLRLSRVGDDFQFQRLEIVGGTTLTDGAMAASSTTLTSASATFTLGDVGKQVSVAGAGAAGATLLTSFSGFVDAHTMTTAAAAVTTVTGATVVYAAGTWIKHGVLTATNRLGIGTDTPAAAWHGVGVESTTSYISSVSDAHVSGSGNFHHLTDGFTYNLSFGTDPTSGDFVIYDARRPGFGGTELLRLTRVPGAAVLTVNGVTIPTGGLSAANNLSDVANVAISRGNLAAVTRTLISNPGTYTASNASAAYDAATASLITGLSNKMALVVAVLEEARLALNA